MNAVERHYRLVTIQERIAQLEGELLVILGDTPVREPLTNRLEGAMWSLQQAARKLELAPVSTKEDLTQLLQLSIVREREQRQCRVIGGEVPSENEAAHAENVSRFLKSSIRTQQGE